MHLPDDIHYFLVAEDNPVDIEIINTMLKKAYQNQYKATFVETFHSIFAAADNTHYDVLILDMNLPDKKSADGVVELQQRYPNLPIIILTEQNDLSVAVQTLKLGVQDFLTKNNVTPQVLSRSLRYAKERKQIEQALKQSVQQMSDQNLQLKHLAHTDHLSGLPNRSCFEAKVKDSIQRAKRTNREFALLYIDLDNFKRVNDNFGHTVGDILLLKVSNRLKNIVRKADFLARIGGDEFVIYTDGLANRDEVYQLIDRILAVFDAPFKIENKEIQSNPSIGIAFYPDADNLELLLKQADYAMYEAKESEDSNVCFYTKEMESLYSRRLAIEAEFDTAIENDEFDVHFQKIESLSHSNYLGFEALLRWRSAKLGNVSPGEFVPIYENSPVINQLTKLVFIKAQALYESYERQGKYIDSIKVNVTASQLSSGIFTSLLLQWLKIYRLPPSSICLELTERQIVKNTRACLKQIKKLRREGVKIALDDFGTGFSSVQHLLEFTIDYIKLDITMIRNIEKHKRKQALVAGIVEMAHRLDLKIVAEGVETQVEYDMCKQLGCDYLQGYFIHRPESMHLITEELNNRAAQND